MMSKAPMIAGTMQTDPRSGGLKRSSGVTVLPIVDEGTSFLDPILESRWLVHARVLLFTIVHRYLL